MGISKIKIYGTNIRIGNSGYINQPKEIIDYIKKLQEKLVKINEILDKYFKDEYFTSNIAKDIQKIINEEE